MEIVKPSPKNPQAAWNALTNPFANRTCGHIIGNVRNCAAKGQIYDTAAVVCRSPKNEAECLQTATTGTMTKKSKWNGSQCVTMTSADCAQKGQWLNASSGACETYSSSACGASEIWSNEAKKATEDRVCLPKQTCSL